MRRTLRGSCIGPVSLVTLLCTIVLLKVKVFASNAKPTPEEIIARARDVVSPSLIGPFHLEAVVRIGLAKGEENGTYLLDWASPDRFRREIHLPGYDEISVADSATLYRKRSVDFTPLVVFRLEELMNPSDMIARLQWDLDHRPILSYTEKDHENILPPALQMQTREVGPFEKETCLVVPAAVPRELCADSKDGSPLEIGLRDTADDESVQYTNYKRVGSAFVAWKRRYFDDEKPVEEADVKHVTKMKAFPTGTFAPPAGAERLDWCYDGNPARLLPFKPPLPADAQDFDNPEILDAFVKADGSPGRLQVLRSGGPAADAAMQKIAKLLAFTPATCGGKPIESEVPVVIGDADLPFALPPGLEDFPKGGEKGYTNPECIHCANPSYSNEAFAAKIQGSVVLSVVIMPDGKAHYIRVLKGLGHGLDQEAVKTIRDDWRLKPAIGPDGKPAAVRMEIDVDFHLY